MDNNIVLVQVHNVSGSPRITYLYFRKKGYEMGRMLLFGLIVFCSVLVLFTSTSYNISSVQ